jgi:hypothetical protein
MKKALLTAFKIPKLAVALMFFLVYFYLETILLMIYYVVQAPLRFLLNHIERLISKILNNT